MFRNINTYIYICKYGIYKYKYVVVIIKEDMDLKEFKGRYLLGISRRNCKWNMIELYYSIKK